MGNDPKDEVRKLDTKERFNPQVGAILKPREDDFDLHYNLLKLSADVARPLPQNDVQQCDFQGCKPATGG
jgi:Na+-translocating ferredoxin:NAD+ oxidoreductase RNF subunit RnfB